MKTSALSIMARETLDRMRGKESEIARAKRKFLDYYKNTEDPEIKAMCKYIKHTGRFEMINTPLSRDWLAFEPTVKRDDKYNMFYVEMRGNRIYWPRKFTKERVVALSTSILLEQDDYSPHRYLADEDVDMIRNFKENGKRVICFECGAMEGLFSRTIMDYLDEAYLFECDVDWKDALEATFSNDVKKVHVISKFVSDITEGNSIKIDDLISEGGGVSLEDTLLVVKMDIEGAEMKALEGMKNLLSNAKNAMLFVCAYHRQNDENEIRDFFKDSYEITSTKGYFCFYVDPMYDEPYVRRCVMKVRKTSDSR